jgi:DNA repair exonuclease SbcCD ATPase subunit
MEKVTVSLEERHLTQLEEFVEDDETAADNRSEAVRELLDDVDRLRERVDDLEADVEAAEARADDLRRQLREANRRDDEVGEIVEYVQEERSVEQRRREAPIWTRAKWKVLGMPGDPPEE